MTFDNFVIGCTDKTNQFLPNQSKVDLEQQTRADRSDNE